MNRPNDAFAFRGIPWRQLAEQLDLSVSNYIHGKRAPVSGELIHKYSARDGQLLAQFGGGTALEVDEAILSARQAFEEGPWSRFPVQRRKEVLLKLAALIDTNREELALRESLDVGKPITDALSIDVPTSSASIRFHAEAADKTYARVYGVDRSSLSYQLHRPIGVVGGIVGWNFPLLLACSKIGPALATGNCLVLKPSEFTSFSASRIAQLAIEAGLPEGVLNVIHGGPHVGAHLARHPDVDLLTFTGSTRTGKQIMIAAGESNMKRVVLECGGKAPNIVFDDSPDLDAVAEAIVARAYWNQGQVCTASSRVLIQRTIKDRLLERIIEKTSALRIGDPLEPSTQFGPVVNDLHRQKIRRYIEVGKKEGATVAYESIVPPPNGSGFYISPVIFDEVSPKQTIAREEIFGPVLSVMTFRDEEEAIQLANDTIYGLSAVLWTKDLGRAHRMVYRIKAGWVVVNSTGNPSAGPGEGVLSVGGHGESGIGIEGGLEGLSEYVTKSAIQFFI